MYAYPWLFVAFGHCEEALLKTRPTTKEYFFYEFRFSPFRLSFGLLALKRSFPFYLAKKVLMLALLLLFFVAFIAADAQYVCKHRRRPQSSECSYVCDLMDSPSYRDRSSRGPASWTPRFTCERLSTIDTWRCTGKQPVACRRPQIRHNNHPRRGRT